MLNFGNGLLYRSTGTMRCWNDFPRKLYMWKRFSVLSLYMFDQIYLPYQRQWCNLIIVCCQHCEVWKSKRHRIYLSTECVFLYVQNVILCTKHIIGFSLGISFPIVCQVRYSAFEVGSGTIPHQTALYGISSSGEDNNRIICDSLKTYK